jgi:topoisomerase-4 subunit A
MTVDEVVRYTAKRLVELLERELEHRKQKLLDELHRKTLVQIFIENRIYKRIEQCKTYEAVTKAVLDGVNKFRDQLRRDVTMEDVEMLLGVRIKRISLFDINKSRSDIDDIVKQLDEVNKNLGQLTKYAIAYLKKLIKDHKDAFPRRTKITSFEEVELRELTANELSMRWDRDNGYFGSQVDGELQFKCSSLDKLIFVWGDGRYKLMTPPDKLFVDRNLVYVAPFDRDKVMTLVYTHHGVAYFKKFTFGGTIMNREYRCTLDPAEITLFEDQPVEELYVKYAPVKNLRIKQQLFDVRDALVKGAKAKGNQMTVKKIRALSTEQPRGWDTSDDAPKGAMVKL